MKKQRQKQISIDAVIKVQNFLKDAQTEIFKGNNFSITRLASDYRIDQMIATLAVRNGYFEKGVVKGEYIIGDKFDSSATGAKKLIEMVRLSKIEKSHAKLSGEIAIKEADHGDNIVSGSIDIVPKIKLPKKGDLTDKLIKWLEGDEPQRTIFYENEKEFEQKLQIACAIATGAYVVDGTQARNFNLSDANDFVIAATNDLYSKLKK